MMRLAVLWVALVPAVVMGQVEGAPEQRALDPAGVPGPVAVPERGLPPPALPHAGWLAGVRAGVFEPTGPSLEGFRRGATLGVTGAYVTEEGFGFELRGLRSSTRVAGSYRAIDVTQTAVVGSLRISGQAGELEAYGSAGVGWFTTTADVSSLNPESSTSARLGMLLTGGIAIPVAARAAVLIEGTYGGAYATLFDGPTWIAGFSLTGGVRVTIAR